MKKITRTTVVAAFLFLIACLLSFFSGKDFRAMFTEIAIFPSSGLTKTRLLSDYMPSLKKTPGDTPVYIYEGEKSGGKLLIVGGSHPNEPAGNVAAILMAETIKVTRGTVFIIPWANRSGFTHNDPHEGNPQKFSVKTPTGERWFRYGSRLTNPVHQWPDPALYVNPSGQKLAGTECRNLNRCYPGREKGYLTERVAYGIIKLIKAEKIDLALDLHEAAPEYPVINAIVFHENSAELAAIALMELQMLGLEFRLEASPPNLRGLSHREWGDHAGVQSILLETANASHGRLKGKPSAALITEGKDKNYVKAGKLGMLFVPFDEEGIPLRLRLARHLAAVQALVLAMAEGDPTKALGIDGWPSPEQVLSSGIGPFLAPQK